MNEAPSGEKLPSGGIAHYFSHNRGVAWLCLIAIFVWGWMSFRQLPQQEDPKIPDRRAVIVTFMPGATSDKVEQLVTKVLEKKSSELSTVEELKSESRHGVSVIYVTLQSTNDAKTQQDWDKLRAKLAEVRLPEGCYPPWLNTDFGNTITMLYAIASEPIGEAEVLARSRLLREATAEIRGSSPAANRAVVAVFCPPSLPSETRSSVAKRFSAALVEKGYGNDTRILRHGDLLGVDFVMRSDEASLRIFIRDFTRTIKGSDGEAHPDFHDPLVVIGDQDPTGAIRELNLPRHTYRQLEVIAENFEDAIKQLPTAGRTQRTAIVPEMVYLDYSSSNLNALRVSSRQIASAVAARNALIPGGTFRAEGRNFPVQVSGEFKNESELLSTVIGTGPTGQPVYLRDVFEVKRGYENPIGYHFNLFERRGNSGKLLPHRAVLLSVEMREGVKIDDFYQQAKALTARFEKTMPDGMRISAISNQPESVANRVDLFLEAFMEAVIVVVIVALFLMDWHSALVVAMAIPLTIAMTFSGMAILGIPLHQISIAGLIITLGILVDNPVVAADGINRELAHGRPRDVAVWLGPTRLFRPIVFGTIINIAAFLPLILLPSDVGAFIYALPVVVTLALAASLLVSYTFTPLLGYYVLKGQKGFDAGAEVRSFFLFKWVDLLLLKVLPRYRRLLELGLDNPLKTLCIVYGILALSFGLVPFLGTQFFPAADRNQFTIDIELVKNASPMEMRRSADHVAEFLRDEKCVKNFGVFYGGSSPRFYYNVRPKEAASYLAQILVNTNTNDDVLPLISRLRARVDAEIPGARIIPRQLEQGIPIDYPIQIRLAGDNLDVLRKLADQVSAVLRKYDAYKVHDDLGARLPTLRIDVDQERANTLGINNQLIGSLTMAAFGTAKITDMREGDHLIPVVARLRLEDRAEADQIRALYVESMSGALIPLESFAKVGIEPAFPMVPHFDQLRTVTVEATTRVGVLPASVLAKARSEIEAISLPAGYNLTFAGESKELNKNRDDMVTVMLVSLSVIFLAIVVQFRSVAKSLSVMVTVPLGLIGAFLGLTLFHTNLGFVAFIAIVSLSGVIVSHIIVLSDFIEESRKEGLPLREALIHAGLVRLRPVIVTVFCTVCGLVPLAISGGDLWHPLCAVHIVGLLCATMCTLVVLPVVYLLFVTRLKIIR
jgi:multidrug efflux pump subunit AcrB